MSEIIVHPIPKSRISEVDFNNIVFGEEFADHMFIIDYANGEWGNARIVPFGDLPLSPALSCMHYGQAIFEGMKAYKSSEGEVLLFRPHDNWERFNISAERMCMPSISEEIFMGGLNAWLKLDAAWVPSASGASLYLRPFMIATDSYLGVKPSQKYSFMIYGCPVNAYYSHPLKIKVEREYVRAAHGGVGFAKAAGNYAAAMLPTVQAQKEGFHQLLWTDARDHEYLEELGTSNFFMFIDDVLVTPELSDTILRGITRDSILELARSWGIKVEERKISVTELRNLAESKRLKEAFATGTAATIATIQSISIDGILYDIENQGNKLTAALSKGLDQLKRKEIKDEFGWVVPVV